MIQDTDTQTAPIERPLTYKQRRDLYEIWRKVNGIQVQLVRLLGELDISVKQ